MPLRYLPLAVTLLALAGPAVADIPPIPEMPREAPPSVAPDAVRALSGTYELLGGSGAAGCDLTLTADSHDPFDAAPEDYAVTPGDEACFRRIFGPLGYESRPLLWNVAAGGGVMLRFDDTPRTPWLTLTPSRDAAGRYGAEQSGQTIALVATFARPRTLD